MQTLILFDIDGTLLKADGAGVRAMVLAAQSVVDPAFHFDGVVFSGGLDPLLFQEGAKASGISVDADDHRRFQAAYERQLPKLLESNEHQAFALPGTLALVAALTQRDDVMLGLLTGNYRRTAESKLRHVGFEVDLFEVGAFGDLAPSRPELVVVAHEQYRALRGGPPHRTLIIGDTPRDVHCALANQVEVLAVATGNYSEQQLRDSGALHVVPDLQTMEPLLALLAMT